MGPRIAAGILRVQPLFEDCQTHLRIIREGLMAAVCLLDGRWPRGV